MKKLLFLMLVVFSIQCEKNKEPKENCGIVTETVTVPSDTKSKPKNIPISYYDCEYIVIMPQNKDSFEVKRILEYNKLVPEKVTDSKGNPLYDGVVRFYRFNPGNSETNPPKVPLPKPPGGGGPVINVKAFKNSIVGYQQETPITLRMTLTIPELNGGFAY